MEEKNFNLGSLEAGSKINLKKLLDDVEYNSISAFTKVLKELYEEDYFKMVENKAC